MTQWEIYDFPYPPTEPHPFVIISNHAICANERVRFVNGLICTSLRTNRAPTAYEVVLDDVNGLSWRTAVACNIIYQLAKSEFPAQRRGLVVVPRRRQIVRVLNDAFAFSGI
jgi:hypothetical protein